MVNICGDAPVEHDLEGARWTRFDYDYVRDVFARFEFRQLLSRFPAPDQVPVQPSLAFEPAPTPAGLRIVEEAAEAASLLDGAEHAGVFTFTEGAGRSSRVLGLGVSTRAQTFYAAKPDAMDAVDTALDARTRSGHDAKQTERPL